MVDIGGMVERLAPLIAQRATEEYLLFVNLQAEATKLSDNLREIQIVLDESERRRVSDPRVKSWLESLEGVTYEIDHTLAMWERIAIRRLQIQESEDDDDDDVPCTWWGKMGIFCHSLCFSLNHVFSHRSIALNIKELNKKVDLIAKESARYTLLPISNHTREDADVDVKFESTTSFGKIFKIEGQENKKNEIVEALLYPCQKPAGDIQVISLVGMGGLGKTTLAQLVFHDPRVGSYFKLKLWICVSHSSDKFWVAKAVLQSLGVTYHKDAALQTLLELIRSSISGKKFLVVLDHVCSVEDSMWKQLEASLGHGAPGSRILVTTRNKYTAYLLDSRAVSVDTLSDSDCWSLFQEVAFCGRTEEEEVKKVEEGIGRMMAEKCRGLPLAAKTLGEYLHSKYKTKLWVKVLHTELWQLEEVAKALFTPLACTYNELPLPVKQCFLYCAIFPKDEYVKVDELMRVWMVHGYLSSGGADDAMEIKGWDYFHKLDSCFFFDRKKDAFGDPMYRMHGIVYDFAWYLTQTGIRKLGFSRSYTNDGLHGLKSVKILILSWNKMVELHQEIGILFQLRYLDLSGNPIRKLPQTICDLCSLQTLGLQNCKELSELPDGIRRLKNLKQLPNISTSRLGLLPSGLGKLTALRTLEEFRVGRGKMTKLRYLAKLNQLQGELRIIIGDLKEEEDVQDAVKAELKSKIHIEDLLLKFEGEVGPDVMEALQAPSNLRNLRIQGFKGTRLPSWVGTSLSKVKVLKFWDCDRCEVLPPLGTLPFLEVLHITRMNSLKRVGHEFLGIVENREPPPEIFPKLKTLKFWYCSSWEEWEDSTGDENGGISMMPYLRYLELTECPRLKGLPPLLISKAKSIEVLIVRQCDLLSERFRYSRDPEETETEWKFLSHIPVVRIHQ